MSLILTDQLQQSRAKIAASGQVSRAQVLSSQQVQDIRGRLIANLQSARSSSFIALLNNQSSS
ncbi:hypothetical protein [Salinibacter phage 4_17]